MLKKLFDGEDKMPKETNEILATAVKKHYRVAYFKAGLLGILLLGGIISAFKDDTPSTKGPTIAQINIKGSIVSGNVTGDGSMLAAEFVEATKNDKVKAILISANSGGGSPTQAEILYQAIYNYTRTPLSQEDQDYLVTNFSEYNPNTTGTEDKTESQSEQTRKPVIVVAQEMCTSACYYMISASDLIISHKASLIGSIGVKVSQWQFKEVLDKFDVGRVNLTTGKNKSLLDPYITLTKESEGLIREHMLTPMFDAFKDAVKEARGEKLIKNDESLFTGLMWTGNIAKNKGLIDQVATAYQVSESMKEHYDADINVVNVEKFSFKKLVTAEAIADILAKALVKANQENVGFH